MDITGVIETHWPLSVQHVEPLTGARDSETWSVVTDAGRFVLKSVDAHDQGFADALERAASFARHGLTTGAPVPTRHGDLVQHLDNRTVAVLEWVDGEPLTTRDPRAAAVVGAMLAQVHQAGFTPPGDLNTWLHRLPPLVGEFIDYEPWIRPVVDATVGDLISSTKDSRLTWAGLHGDPSPSSFLVRSEDTALIDWCAAMHGPALYDLASAAMFLGASTDDTSAESIRRYLHHKDSLREQSPTSILTAAYIAGSPSMTDEVTDGLTRFLRLRWCVQAGYFAWRCANDVRTGMPTDGWNDKGLRDAREALALQSS